jgi:7,8-dihydroneopterin aldolase/epimerase/oxygenase
MGKISLLGMEFFAHHGYYEEERQMGNTFTVDITLKAPFQQAATHDTLADTINYEEVYALVKHQMEQPSALLEHVADRIGRQVLEQFPSVVWVKVGVAKHNPPIGGKCHQARIQTKYHR